MKLEELYLTLQERYQEEMERKERNAKEYKEKLKEGILKIIHYAGCAVRDNLSEIYDSYEILMERGHEAEDLYILFKIDYETNQMELRMHSGGYFSNIGKFLIKFCNNKEDTSDLYLDNPLNWWLYYREHYTIQTEIFKFKELKFNLKDSTINFEFYEPSGKVDLKIIEKVTLDFKEMFPNLKEIYNTSSSITLILKYFGTEILNQEKVEEEEKLKISINELNLCKRTHRALEYNRIYTVGDLIKLSESELESLSSVGKTAVKEIKERLQESGLTLRGY